MKLYKISILSAAAFALVACDDIDNIMPQGDGILDSEMKEINVLEPSRAEAAFAGMFTMMGQPYYAYPSNGRADDFGFIMAAISQDAEGPDLTFPNSGYNWFSTCGELSSRTPSYANPTIRYKIPYTQIKLANDIINSYGEESEDSVAINHIAQARALRAYDYLTLAPSFQFSYSTNPDAPCVPIVTEKTTEFSNNPRASVKEVYDLIIADCTYAIEHLTAARSNKMYINQNVAYGLRARAYLATEQWELALADAKKAAEGYTPASISDVSTPSFYDINDENWIWGYDMTTSMADGSYGTSCSWIGSFSNNSYSCGVAVYAQINNLLYNKIPQSDVRKGWWVDENLHSDLLSTVSWDGVTGDAISKLKIDDVKEPYLPYTNVKFGAPQIPTDMNDSDWPFMRVEEMILIQAECQAHLNNADAAKKTLEKFIKNNRDPKYDVEANLKMRNIFDEIWFQRRVELWGEGFGWSDMMRLRKPLVRFHGGEPSNLSDAFQFNMEQGDGYMLMRFPQSETNTNYAVAKQNNTAGSAPTPGANPNLRDGVTD